ncbi:MAG: 4Fe-4S binding protein [Firmicutes bacterium]|nr:4Fe-4S binding protein [Bacillota bacterium]
MRQRYLKNVATLNLDEAKCAGCGMCLEVCPHQVFKMESAKAQILDRDNCMECGACARNCPSEAISVRAGVGCAAAIVMSKIRGSAPCCGESSNGEGSCCG